MRRNLPLLFAAAALFTVACSDNQLAPDRATAPEIGSTGPTPRYSLVQPPAVCPSVESSQKTVDTLLPQIFGPGQGRRGKAQGYSNDIVQARRNGDTQIEEAYVDSLINYTLQNYFDGNLIGGQSEATQNRVLSFFYALYCASGIEPIPDLSYIFTTENTKLIRYNTPTTTVSADSAAVQIEKGEVPDTIFGTWVSVIRAGQPLPTTLDWYGIDGYRAGAWEFVANPPVTFTNDVLVGVCVTFDNPTAEPSDLRDLRLAHAVEEGDTATSGNAIVKTAGGIIEIAQYASPNPLGLACDLLPSPSASRGVLGQWLHQFASLFVPQQLYALTSGGSTGGTVRKFSPFAAVDIKLTATATGPSSPQYIPVGSTTITTPVSVTLKTRNNATPVDSIPVKFAPSGSFSPTADTTSGGGTAGSTWTLVAGANSGIATSAKTPLRFVPDTLSFSVTAVQLTALSITTTSLPDGQKTVAYGPVTLRATGGAGAGTYSWALAPGSNPLPSGLTLSDSVLSGTPTVAGTSFTFTIRVTSGGLSADQAFTIAIAQPPVSITTTSLPAATVGIPYSQTLQATGGDGAYSWTKTGGSLPTGLSLSGGGVLSGTPSVDGTFNFTVQASSAGGTLTASKAFALTVAYPSALGSLVFQPGPSGSLCYALNVTMATIGVKVTTTTGDPVEGVRVDLVAVTNNGSKVAVSQPFAITGANGIAVFDALSINKTGGYRLVASTAAPWPVKSVHSGKFNISPSC